MSLPLQILNPVWPLSHFLMSPGEKKKKRKKMRTSVLGRGRIQDCDGTAFTAQPSGWSTGKSPHKAVKKREILKSCR